MGSLGLQTHIWNNNLRSIFLLVGFPFLLVGIVCALELAAAIAGLLPSRDEGFNLWAVMAASVPGALVVAGLWFVVAYFFNQVIIDMATGARTVERREMPELYNLLENLCISRGLRMPTLKIIETDAMNAFASGLHEGRFNVTVTRGLLQNLNREEVEAVLAHELTHIINRDVRTMVIASVFAGIITLLCQMIFRFIMWGGVGGSSRDRRGNTGLFVIVALAIAAVGYLLAIVIQMALSRSREYVADAGSVELTKNPDAMISALVKVSGNARVEAPQSVRAMFLEDSEDGLMGLFVTHPPLQKRIAALQKFAGGRLINQPNDPISNPQSGPWSEPPPDRPIVEDERKGPWG